MTFANPDYLWLLLVFPPGMILFFWWAGRARKKLWTQFIQSRLLPGLITGISPVRTRIRLGCLVAAVAGLIIALARPQWGYDWETVKQRGLDIVVAIDTSKSMLATDAKPNRLAAAKLAALDLMQQAKSDRLGLVAFAGNAFLECPLTIDDSAFRQGLTALDVNSIPEGGTSLSSAIETALASFKEGDNYKILVLITDGEDQEPGAVEAAKKAADAGLKIFTIGVGTAAGDLLRMRDDHGGEDYVRDQDGNVVKSHLNESLLQEIAADADGFYLHLGLGTIDSLYSRLAQFPKSEGQEQLVRRYHERYHLPLGFAIVCLIAEMLIPESSRQRRSKVDRTAATSPAVATALVLLALAFAPRPALGSAASALHDYNTGDFEHALTEYERLANRPGADPRLHFNAGAAAYRSGKFAVATNQFSQALESPDPALQALAYYNRGNALFRLGDQEADQDKKSRTWERSALDYKSVLGLNTNDVDAKFNLEYVMRKIEELKKQQQQQQNQKSGKPPEPSEAARRAKAQADQAVVEREYRSALDIMEKQLSVDPTTSYYSDYIQRLREVNGVKETPQH